MAGFSQVHDRRLPSGEIFRELLRKPFSTERVLLDDDDGLKELVEAVRRW
jgi:hypothetical protein